MSLPSPQPAAHPPAWSGPAALRGLAALLLAALPGALLLCILHCAALPPAHAHHDHGSLLFYCHFGRGDAAEAPLPVSPAVVIALIQSVQSSPAPVVPGPALGALLCWGAAALGFGRLAEAPPAPPPRAARGRWRALPTG